MMYPEGGPVSHTRVGEKEQLRMKLGEQIIMTNNNSYSVLTMSLASILHHLLTILNISRECSPSFSIGNNGYTSQKVCHTWSLSKMWAASYSRDYQKCSSAAGALNLDPT